MLLKNGKYNSVLVAYQLKEHFLCFKKYMLFNSETISIYLIEIMAYKAVVIQPMEK